MRRRRAAPRDGRAIRRAAWAACLSGLAAAGCGSAGSDAASRPVPPTPVDVSALVSDSHVALSPARIGAGPVMLTVTNQGVRSHALVVTRMTGTAAVARTAPINPQGATQLSFSVRRGRYSVSLAAGRPARTDAARSRGAPASIGTTLVVGRERPSGGGALLNP